jgi:23S rRNA pseudouridine2457 synthase
MEHLHYKLYKPYGMLSQMLSRDPKERKKRFLGQLGNFAPGTMPVGRLDERSEGLLLMTTDGGLSDLINRSGVEKEYYAQLDGRITRDALERIQKGVQIGISGEKYSTLPCQARLLTDPPSLPEPDASLRIGRHRPDSWISLTLSEGKFRQVRKMTAAVGFPTLRLVRVRVGSIELGDLAPGEVQRLEKLIP